MIYWDLYQYITGHNNEMLQHLVISKEVHSHRKRKNGITMAGQVTTFVVSMLVSFSMTGMLIILDLNTTPLALFYVAYLKIAEPGMLSAIQVLSSTELRNQLYVMFGIDG